MQIVEIGNAPSTSSGVRSPLVGNITAFGCTVVPKMILVKSEGLAAPVSVATVRLYLLSATIFSSPMRQRISDDHVVAKELLAAVGTVRYWLISNTAGRSRYS